MQTNPLKRRELEQLLGRYGIPRRVRIDVSSALSDDALGRLIRQLKRRSFWRLGRE